MTRHLFKSVAFAAATMATALLATVGTALAEDFPKATIFIVNYGQIQIESKAAQNVRKQVHALEAHYKAKNEAEMAALRREQQTLREEAPKLSAAKRATLQKTLEVKVAATQRKMQARNHALQQAVEAAGQKISQALVPIFSDLMGKRGGNVLLGTQEVVYYDPSLSITDKVIKALNAKLSVIKVKIPASH